MPASSTPYKAAFTTPSFFPAHMVSPLKGDQRLPYISSSKIPVKRALNDYFGADGKQKESGTLAEKLGYSS
ncbi:hypothetical protein CDL15_Pgr017111 [Punica granatum]|uniref:Uncharacterized protein n=1 Tax=Punica granatum TaxID=22663 RepID=A0A218VYI7_PUNGR|nr:hypothetical protein CDL15_Pgr017111 [Punica granatum]